MVPGNKAWIRKVLSETFFSVEALPEDVSPKGNASAIDEETDRKVLEHIYAEQERGNEWAWAVAKVTASHRPSGLKGEDFLGGCSYKSAKDFIMHSGYYEDMKRSAFDSLIREMLRLKAAIE
jgi:hypothetical protein